MKTPSPTLLLRLALGALLLAGCQATAPEPKVEQAPAAEQTPAVSPTEAEAEPTASPTAASQDLAGETIAPEAMPSEETRAANADVAFVHATQAADGTWRFDVTVRHPDTGWEDYADGWDVMTPDGQVLKVDEDDPFTRLLLHPHENEQPFTRSQSGIVVPEGVTVVIVRAHDLVDGFGGREIEVDLTVEQGSGFEVSRQ